MLQIPCALAIITRKEEKCAQRLPEKKQWTEGRATMGTQFLYRLHCLQLLMNKIMLTMEIM